jgi:four helix bundle protein
VGTGLDDASMTPQANVCRLTHHTVPLSSFEDLVVWQKAMSLVVEVYQITSSFPAAERFGLTSQIRRATCSVPANIAEGFGRTTTGEFLNQLSVARGSLNEVATFCTISERLGFASAAQLGATRGLIADVGRMLVRLRQSLDKKRGAKARAP